MRIETNPQAIELNIPDVVIDSTILKRKAKLFTMIYNQNSKSLTLNWTVSFFANDGGNYGEPLSFIPSYSKESIADNTTAVNPATGQIISMVDILDADGNVTGQDYAIDWMGQYDFFNMLAENQPIQVHDMIRQYGIGVSNWDK